MKRNSIISFYNEKREYINKRTLEVTGRFQKHYNLEKRDKKGNEYWVIINGKHVLIES